jgi:uncharacterized protein YeaO (DUF488 family)
MGKLKSSAMPKYVMRNRGNNEVAPSQVLLETVKSGQIDWDEYEKRYLTEITDPSYYSGADNWIKDIVAEMKGGMHVILICFEKDATHCHRRLLAEEIKRQWPEIDYKGELTLP